MALLVAVNVHALLWWRTRSRREWLTWLAANVVIALAFLPWLPTFIAQQSHALNTSPRTPTGLAADTLTAYGGGIAHGDACSITARAGRAGHCGRVVCLARGRRPTPSAARCRADLADAAGAGAALGLRSGLYEVRYLVVSLPGLLLLAAVGIVRALRRPGRRLLARLYHRGAAALGLQQQYFDPALARDDYRDLVAAIQRDALPDDAVILSAPNQIEVFAYYYHGPLATIGLPAQRPIDPEDTYSVWRLFGRGTTASGSSRGRWARPTRAG